MDTRQFKSLNLSSYVKREQYPSTDVAMQVLKYKNERLDYWFGRECDCPYTMAQDDVRKKFGHLLQVR